MIFEKLISTWQFVSLNHNSSLWLDFYFLRTMIFYDFYGFEPLTIYNMYHAFFLFFVYFLPLTIFIVTYKNVITALRR